MSKLAAAGDSSAMSPGWAISRGDGHGLVHRRRSPHRHAVDDERLELVGGLADQHERADARRDRVGECGVVEALVLAAGDQHDRGIEGLEGRDRRLRDRGLRVVDPAHAVPLGDRLEPMRDPGERARHGSDRAGVDADQTRRERGPEHVGEHVAAGQAHVLGGDDPLATDHQPAVLEPCLQRPATRPVHAVPRQRRGWQPLPKLAGAGVVVVEHDPSVRHGQLRKQRLDRPVRLDGAVAVQVVLGDVRVQGDVDAAADRRQLQLGELEHDPVVRPELERPLDQRRADVPAQDGREAALGQHRRQQRRGRRLALRAGHARQPRAGEAHEEVDLAEDLGAAPLGCAERLAKPRVGRGKPG